MTPRFRNAVAAALLMAGPAGAIAVSRVRAHDHATRPPILPRERLPLPDARYARATVSVRGRLGPLAHEWVRVHGRGGRALIVVLRGHDVAVCEDLGHQLREVLRAAGSGVAAIAVVDREEDVAGFLRREHLHFAIGILSPDSVLDGGRTLVTPAVLVTRDGALAEGTAHPVRFANLRAISFAAELKPLLTGLAAPRTGAVER
jgi:hypothetical protein